MELLFPWNCLMCRGIDHPMPPGSAFGLTNWMGMIFTFLAPLKKGKEPWTGCPSGGPTLPLWLCPGHWHSRVRPVHAKPSQFESPEALAQECGVWLPSLSQELQRPCLSKPSTSAQEEVSGLALGSITNLCLSLQMSVEEGQRGPVLCLSPQFSLQAASGVGLGAAHLSRDLPSTAALPCSPSGPEGAQEIQL